MTSPHDDLDPNAGSNGDSQIDGEFGPSDTHYRTGEHAHDSDIPSHSRPDTDADVDAAQHNTELGSQHLMAQAHVSFHNETQLDLGGKLSIDNNTGADFHNLHADAHVSLQGESQLDVGAEFDWTRGVGSHHSSNVTFTGYARCSKCLCGQFEGYASCCANSGCGHSYSDHF